MVRSFVFSRRVVATSVAVWLLVAAVRSAWAAQAPLEVVPDIDLERYQGTWYEIARLPNRFQDQCASDVSAHYTLRDDGRVEVTNRCLSTSGESEVATGVARRVDGAPSSVLQVRFAPRWLSWLPFVWGDYQVIALDAGYRHVLVGTPDRKYLWILARERTLARATYDALVQAAADQDFDTSRLLRTQQNDPLSRSSARFAPTRP